MGYFFFLKGVTVQIPMTYFNLDSKVFFFIIISSQYIVFVLYWELVQAFSHPMPKSSCFYFIISH